MSDNSNYTAALIGEAAAMGGVADPAGTVLSTCRRTYSIKVQDAATAGTAVTETVLEHVRRACKVLSVTVEAPIAVAAAASNIATFTIAKRTGAGGANTVATGSTVTAGTPGALTAFVPAALPLTYANIMLAAGDVLTLAIAKGASGVALTAATSYFTVSVDVEESI